MSYYPNPTGYGAPPPQPRGPVVAAPAPVRTAPAQRAAPAAAARAAVAVDSGSKHPAGRCANATLAILGGYAAEQTGKKRKASDAVEALDRLVPPLFLCAKHSIGGEHGASADVDDGGEGADTGGSSKRAGGDGEGDQVPQEQADDGGKAKRSKRLKEELERHKKHNQLLAKRRENVYKSMVALHEMYETGLDGIARMNDLRFCPDNVMPDDIPR